MRTARQRAADVKLLVGATIGVLLAGAFILGALLTVTDDGSAARCGRLPIGPATTVRAQVDRDGPSFLTGGEGCSFWLTFEDGDLVAYRIEQPDCTLDYEREQFRCGGRIVDPVELAEYPVSVIERDGTDTLVVDLTPV